MKIRNIAIVIGLTMVNMGRDPLEGEGIADGGELVPARLASVIVCVSRIDASARTDPGNIRQSAVTATISKWSHE